MLATLSGCWQGLSDAGRVHQMSARPIEFEDGRRELEDGHPRAALSLSTPSVEGPLLWCTTPSLAFWFSPVLGAHVPRTSTWQSSRGSEDSPEEPGAQRQKPRCVGGPQLSAASLAKTIDAHTTQTIDTHKHITMPDPYVRPARTDDDEDPKRLPQPLALAPAPPPRQAPSS